LGELKRVSEVVWAVVDAFAAAAAGAPLQRARIVSLERVTAVVVVRCLSMQAAAEHPIASWAFARLPGIPKTG
jgi:hypothetical protein